MIGRRVTGFKVGIFNPFKTANIQPALIVRRFDAGKNLGDNIGR